MLRIVGQTDLVVRVPAMNLDLVGVRDVVDADGLEGGDGAAGGRTETDDDGGEAAMETGHGVFLLAGAAWSILMSAPDRR